MSDPVRGVVVGHASLAAGMVACVRQIAGAEEEALFAVSNEGCGPETLQNRLTEALGDGPAIVFTDLGSGSCAFAARRVAMERPNTAILTGVNLPILLDFVFHRTMPLGELVERLVEKGRTGVSGTHREGAAHADRAVSR
jgi:mannose/fructose-specific phosphotransferase system component IIA